MPKMRVHQLISLLGVTKWFGGGMAGVVAGRKALTSAQTLAATLHDGGLVVHTSVVPLRCSCLS